MEDISAIQKIESKYGSDKKEIAKSVLKKSFEGDEEKNEAKVAF